MNYNEFLDILGKNMANPLTMLREYRLDNVLIAMMIIDRFDDGWSAVYSCYDPQYLVRGLGNFMICDSIKQCQDLGLEYLYLGFYIHGADKMEYKMRFKPHQFLTPMGWRA